MSHVALCAEPVRVHTVPGSGNVVVQERQQSVGDIKAEQGRRCVAGAPCRLMVLAVYWALDFLSSITAVVLVYRSTGPCGRAAPGSPAGRRLFERGPHNAVFDVLEKRCIDGINVIHLLAVFMHGRMETSAV